MITPVILCGGSGTRLWPTSRQSRPKQFSSLLGEESLLSASIRRFIGKDFEEPIVVTSESLRFLVGAELKTSNAACRAMIVEPEPKNTAPAILAAALWLSKQDPNSLMLVSPSDHIIGDPIGFRSAVAASVSLAHEDRLITFGIRPTRPETGYGYLQLSPGGDISAETPQRLERFVEKPGHDQALTLIDSGRCLWNAGIFLFSSRSVIDAFKRYAPDVMRSVSEALANAKIIGEKIQLDPVSWGAAPSISIDYAVMEKASNVYVTPYSGQWTDLGSWQSVWQESKKDELGNVVSSKAMAIDCENTLLRSEAEGLQLVGIGLNDIVAIAMPDAVLVAHSSSAQRVKEAADALKDQGIRQATQFTSDHRPWGSFETLAKGEQYHVKRIVVQPGAALSLQSHKYRAEHWIVLEGKAKVTIGEKVDLLTADQSAYIPLGAIHRLENPGSEILVLIEIQTGTYFGEDDIVRYEDVYSRV